MISKSEEMYRQLFQSLNDFAEENNVELRSLTIITDFKRAAIKASQREFSDINNKRRFFHLSQSEWCKIQEVELATQYGVDEHLNLILHYLFILAFLPSDDISDAFDILKSAIPEVANDVVKWFKKYYVHKKI